MTAELTGWLLDVYEDPQDGMALWLLADDGRRVRLAQPFPVTFYAAGPAARLRQLWRWLEAQPGLLRPTRLAREERRDLFYPQPRPVLAIEVCQPAAQAQLFRRASEAFPELDFYDADIQVALRHAARYGTFPLARCAVTLDPEGRVAALRALDTPWALDPPPPPLRIFELEPDVDPDHAAPRSLLLRYQRFEYRLALEPARPLLVNLQALLARHDPDLLQTAWGDTWLLPRLLALSKAHNLPLALNREPRREVTYKGERTYFSYGQIIYRGQQIHLFGRWHIDRCNAVLWGDYGLDGTLEAARVTALPLQTAARASPGTGISSMQIVTALRAGVLVPWRKQQAEFPKTALDLLQSDMGGLIYQPTVGLHRDVGEIDFISMYPSVMVRFNISPETMRARPPGQPRPSLPPDHRDQPPGLIPQTLGPLLEKRIALKRRLAELPRWHPRLGADKARSSAHKWLLVTCFGYLGYKNARFGRIEAHEAVTAHGREALLRAKEAAEDAGFEILHLYVDGLWVKRLGSGQVDDYTALLDEIAGRTGLAIALDGIFRWVAFLPSRVDERVPVANRYFGVFQDGSIKVRGIEARRRDTAPFVAQTQMALLEHLAQGADADAAKARLPGALNLLRMALQRLRRNEVPLEDLITGQKLSKALEDYTSPSPAARAAAQLARVGKQARPGQRVRLIYMLGEPGVHAWDLPDPPDRAGVDLARYRVLLLRAAGAIFQPFGMSEQALLAWAVERRAPPRQLRLPGGENLRRPAIRP